MPSRNVSWNNKRSKKQNMSMFEPLSPFLVNNLHLPSASSLPSVLPREKPRLSPSKHHTTRRPHNSYLHYGLLGSIITANNILRGLVLAWASRVFNHSLFLKTSSTQLSNCTVCCFDTFLPRYALCLRI